MALTSVAPSRRVRTESFRSDGRAFQSLLHGYRSCVEEELANGDITNVLDTGDVGATARAVLSLSDPTELVRMKMAQDDAMALHTRSELERIWTVFDVDRDGRLSKSENRRLVEEYVTVLREFLPQMVKDNVAALVKLYIPSNEMARKTMTDQIVAISQRDVNYAVDEFVAKVKSNLGDLSDEIWEQMDVNKDGIVTKEEFLENFLTLASFPDFSHAMNTENDIAVPHYYRQHFRHEILS